MIIDAISFFQENDMVDFRLQYLWSRVDQFVVAEASHTHSGNPKPWNFDQDRFAWAKEKLLYGKITFPDEMVEAAKNSEKPKEYTPNHPAWKLENYQRDAIELLCRNFSDDDILMLSDCDEIPSHDAIYTAKLCVDRFPMTFDQKLIFYNLTNYNKQPWGGTVVDMLGHARKVGMQYLRDNREHHSVIRNAGHHLTYFGGAQSVKSKLESFAHMELNKTEFTDITHIEESLKNSTSLFREDSVGCYKVGKDFYHKSFLKLVPDSWWGYEAI